LRRQTHSRSVPENQPTTRQNVAEMTHTAGTVLLLSRCRPADTITARHGEPPSHADCGVARSGAGRMVSTLAII